MTPNGRGPLSDSCPVRPLFVMLVLALLAGCTSSPSPDLVEAEVAFGDVFTDRLAIEGLTPKEVCPQSDPVAERVLAEYGAMFVPSDGVMVMNRCVFEAAEQVEAFQARLVTESGTVEAKTVTLQAEAFAALESARADAAARGLTISPRGPFPAARDFDTTVDLWGSRVGPALEFWQEEGRLTEAEVARVVNADPAEQVEAVLSFEERGMFFSTEFDRSILASVAAPGTSQHLSLLAFDVVEHKNPDVRAVLAAHGWIQTVVDDPPHFTYLGFDERELADRGLEQVTRDGRTYWVPAI